jgi:ribosome biogenesis GTPase
MSRKKRKIRTEFRKNREVRTRDKNLTQRLAGTEFQETDEARDERVRARGRFSRKRTVADAEIMEDSSGTIVLPAIDRQTCRLGRALRVQGLLTTLADEEGRIFRCATRRLLKSISTDQRHVVVAGDRVWFRPEGTEEGIIERVEPRRGVLSRDSRGKQHIIVTNVDQMLIVSSAAEPRIKPNLIDRYLVTAERSSIRPIICINKIDLVDPADLMPLVGVWGQLGYRVILSSVLTGLGIDCLKEAIAGVESVVTGQSGVGKTSLLNAIEPGLGRRVQAVSSDTQKGRHTTSTAELLPLSCGGYVVDTPGIRQFQLWDVIPEELAGFFRELRPFVNRCRYPNCTHTHEEECAVKDAVADGWIDARRYESYIQMHAGR